MTNDLLLIDPLSIPRPTKNGKTYYARGEFDYFHYGCDGINDIVSILPVNLFFKSIVIVGINFFYDNFERYFPE